MTQEKIVWPCRPHTNLVEFAQTFYCLVRNLSVTRGRRCLPAYYDNFTWEKKTRELHVKHVKVFGNSCNSWFSTVSKPTWTSAIAVALSALSPSCFFQPLALRGKRGMSAVIVQCTPSHFLLNCRPYTHFKFRHRACHDEWHTSSAAQCVAPQPQPFSTSITSHESVPCHSLQT